MNPSARQSIPALIALSGVVMTFSPFYLDHLYGNFIVASGLLLLFISWIVASFLNKENLVQQKRWQNQTKAMIAMSAMVFSGLCLLTYYEMQMPKYHVATIEKELYRVPPQLNKRELLSMGAECNLYGDQLCSYAVFAKIVKMDSRNFKALANLAIAQSHLGFHEHAVKNFETAIKFGEQSYDTYLIYGNSLLALNKKRKAIRAFAKSLYKNPKQEKLKLKIRRLSNIN